MRFGRILLSAAIVVMALAPTGRAMAQSDPLKQSRGATVRLTSKSGQSSGTGFFISDQVVMTCFHVVSAIERNGDQIKWTIYQDIEVVLPTGEAVPGTIASVPTQADASPLINDFAIVKLSRKPKTPIQPLQLAKSNGDEIEVGNEVFFSGFPLAVNGMVTHRGMVSGFEATRSLIFVQSSINKGNSGGALLNSDGQVIGIVSMREGGISQGLADLNKHIEKTSSQGGVLIMGVDPLQATKAIVQTLDNYISTGIGYAWNIRFARQFLEKNPQLTK